MLQENLAVLHYDGEVVSEVLVLTAVFSQEGDQWAGECLELGTAMCADSLEETRKDLYEAIGMLVDQVNRDGCAATYLREHGVRPIPVVKTGPGSGCESYIFEGVPN